MKRTWILFLLMFSFVLGNAQTTQYFEVVLLRTNGTPLTGATAWLVPVANVYPNNRLALTAHPQKLGVYYRNAVPVGLYDIWVDQAHYNPPGATVVSGYVKNRDSVAIGGAGTIVTRNYYGFAADEVTTTLNEDSTISVAPALRDSIATAFVVNASQTASIDSLRDGIVVSDTTALKISTGNSAYLKTVVSGKEIGGGVFVKIDSTYPEGVVAFNHPTAGKQWVRTEFLAGQVRPEWAGAVGDSLNDDSHAFNAVMPLAVNRSLILSKDKTYLLLTDSIHLMPNIVVIGNNARVVRGGQGRTAFRIGDNVYAPNIRLQGIQFLAASSTRTYIAIGISHTQETRLNLVVSGCTFMNFRGTESGAIFSGGGGSDVTVNQCSFIDNATDIALNTNNKRWAITENRFFRTDSSGSNFISLAYNSDYTMIRGNLMENCGRIAIESVHDSCIGLLITDNVIRYAAMFGISVGNIHRSVIANNEIVDCIFYAIELAGSDNLVEGNVLYSSNNNTFANLLTQTGRGYRNVISNNYIVGGGTVQEGVIALFQGSNNTITHNRIIRPRAKGIYVTGAGTAVGLSIADNYVSDFPLVAIEVFTPDSLYQSIISGNVCYDSLGNSTAASLFLAPTLGVNQTVIRDNLFISRANVNPAIRVWTAIKNSSIQNNTQYGYSSLIILDNNQGGNAISNFQSAAFGFGTIAPDSSVTIAGGLHSTGGVFFPGLPTGTGTAVLSSSGSLVLQTSLRNEKTNIAGIPNAKSLILNLMPRLYTWKRNNQRAYGFIAEDVEALDKRLAQYANGHLVNYDDRGILAIVVQRLKEQDHEISALRGQIRKLLERIR